MKGPAVHTLIPAVVVVIAASTAKADLEVMVKQAANITTKCCKNGIVVEEIIVTFNGIKDINKRIKSLTQHKEIKYLMIYSAKSIANSEKEFMQFVDDMQTWYGIDVKRIT